MEKDQGDVVNTSLKEAKTALMRALRDAEDFHAPKTILTKLERLCGQTEALQHSLTQAVR